MIEALLLRLIGYGVFAGLIIGVWKANSRRWNRLAAEYRAVETPRSHPARTMQTVILVGRDLGWNSYRGLVTVNVTPAGIALRLMPPFSACHPPLLIPFADVHVEPKRWYLVGKTFQYRLSRVGDVQIIVHDDLHAWIESQAAELAVMSESNWR